MKAKILTFVRGLKNGTPPRFQSYLKSLTLLLVMMMSVNVWGETYKDVVVSFTSSTKPTGWNTNGTFNSSYYKMTSGQYAETSSITTIIPSNEVLDSDFKVNVACGTFGTWSGNKNVTVTASLLDANGTSLSSGSQTYSGLNSTQGTYRGEITITKPSDVSKIAKLKIVFSNFTTGTELRFAGLKLNYTTKASAPAVVRTVTWKVNNETYTVGNPTTQVNDGEAVTTLPTAPTTDCGGKTFVGWTAIADYSHATAAPDDLFSTAADAPTVSGGNVTYYAVFADEKNDNVTKQFENLSFTAADDVTYPTGDDNLKMHFLKGGASTNPGNYNNGVRLYQTGSGNSFGGYITIESTAGNITEVSFRNTGTYATSVKFSINKGTTLSDAESVAKNGTITKKDLSTKSFYLYNVGTGSSGRLEIDLITIKYGGTTYSNYTTTCCTKHEVKKGTMAIGGFTATPAQACADVEITLVPEEVTGYNFTGWTSSPNVTITDNKFSMPDEDITITANYEAISYNITYNLDGGAWNGEAGVATYTYGTGVPTLPTNVEKANNTFLGWYVTNPAEIVTSIGTTETGDKSFIASWLPSGARDVAYSGDEQLVYTSNPQIVDKDDASLTVTYSVNKGYTISAVAVTVNDAALTESEVVFNDEQLTITPTAGFTGNVSITFTVVNKMFTVTWMANKTQFKQEQIQEGSKVSLPTTNPSDVDGDDGTYKFQGWFTEEQYSNETTAPAYITNNTIEPTGDVTYYAVYAIVTPGPVSNDYAKITATTDLVEDGQYIIASGTKALNSDVYNEHYMTATGVTISNNKITNTNTKLVWTIEDVNGGNVLFKSNGNGNYLQIIQDGTYRNLIAKNNDATNANKSYFTPSVNSGNWTLEANSVEGYYVGYKSGSGYTEFTAVTPSSNLQLYKRQNNPDTYKNYRTRVAIIDYIAVHEAPLSPERTNLVAGETFDATGLTIDVHYQGEDVPTNVTTGFTFAPTGALKTTDENITFSYQGKQVLLPISVSNTVSKIEVTTDPTKMEYTEGQQFDPAGMVVTATYDNSAERDVTGYTYTPTGDLALSDKITISFGGQTTELGITINEATKTTVNWFVEGVKLTEGEQSTAVIPGKKITVLPTEPEACQGNQFVGWTAVDANYYNATTAPTDLFKTLAEAPTIGETETNFYAVFASEAVGTYDEKVTLTSLTAPTADKFTYAFAKSSGSTSPSWNADQAKTYVKNTLTVTSKNSRVITKIEYTYNINKNDKGTAPTGATVTGNNSDNGSWDATNKTWTSSTNAATTVTLTVNGSAGNYGFTAIKVYLTGGTVLSDYSTTCLAALANPTITTAEGEYCGFVDVEITQPAGNPEGAKIMYSTDNTNWNEYEATVKLEASGTIYAKVVKDPKQTEVVSATYTVYPEYNLTQAATAAASATDPIIGCVSFTDLLVNGKSSNMLFTEDADGNVYTFSYKGACDIARGDKIEAMDAHLTFSKVNGVLNFASVDDVTTMSQNNPTKPSEATAITAIKAGGYYAHVVKLANVTMHVVDATAKSYTLIDEETNEIAIANTFIPTLPTWLEGAKYDVYGIIVLDGEGNPMIAPRNSKGANEDGDMISLAEKLATPEDLAVSNITSCGASFAWGEVTNASKYSVYIYDKDEKEVAKSENRTTRTYTPTTKFEANSTYTWKVKAIGDNVSYTESDYAQGTFTTNPNAKLNWYVGGEFYKSTDASQEKVVTPEDPESPCATNYENFVTWYTEEIVSETGQITALDAAKKVKAGDAAASQAGSAKEYNFYAVFGKIKTQGTDKYVKVTEAPDNWKGEYLIGYDEGEDKESLTVFDGSLTTLDAENNNKTVSFEEDGSIAAATNEGYQFNIEKSTTEGYYTIQSASGKYIANTTNGNKLSESSTTAYKNTISWSERVDIATGENATASHLSFNSDQNQMRFRYYTSNKNNIVLYKRTTTNPTYSGYITTCPQTYTITIANNAKGLVEAATTTEILKGAKVLLTATANAGYTKTGGNWIVKNTTTLEVVEGLVGPTNYLTMPDYDVTVDYNFIAKTDNFVDNLHGNTTIERGGANYELPSLTDFEGETGKPSDNFKKFIGWSATSYDSGEPATEQPTILEGNQTATGATYFAVWFNGSGKYITEYCQTAVPTNLHLVEEYHKATSVRIDWNNVDGADKYHIIVMDGEANIIADADVTESLYDLSGLTPGATYICTVKAHKDCWSDETEGFEFTTKENIQSYAVTINAEGGTYTIDPELEDGKIQEGATVTITNIAPTDADHYFFKELTVPEATDLTEITGGYKFTMPGKAVTINIVFAEYPTVTWKMEGAADQTSTAVRNDDKFEVGTVKNAPANWKYKAYFPEFAGWVTSDKCDAEGNVTTAEFITATTEVPADGLTVYGAVARSASADMSNATKVTSNANLDMTAHYVIGGEKNSTKYFYSSYSNTDEDESWGIGSSSSAIVFTISGSAEALVLQDKVGNYFVATGNKKNRMSTTEGTITLDGTGNIKGTSVYYRFNPTGIDNTNPGFRWYTSSTTCDQAYLYKVGLIYENLTINPQPDYGRTDLVVGNYGTVCVPYAVKTTDRSGATFWNIETSNAPGYPNPTSVTIVQVEGDLEAGKPYIFYAEETTMSLFFSDDKYEGTESVEANGLFGNLTDGTITINDQNDPNAGPEPTRGFFFVLQQKLYECGWNCTVAPNRGWVQAAAIEDETTPSPAPRRVIGNPNGTPTGINNLNVDGWVDLQGAHKYFQNNHIVIVNEGRIYNAQGILIQ